MVYLERTREISSTELRNKKFGILKGGIVGYGRIANRFVEEARYVSGINMAVSYTHLDVYKRQGEHSFTILLVCDVMRFRQLHYIYRLLNMRKDMKSCEKH